MKKHHFLFWMVPAMVVSACSMPTALQNTIITYTPHPVVPVPEKLVVANLFDVEAQNYRDNKDELFVKLIEETVNRTATVMGEGFEVSASAEPDLIRYADSLLARQQASHGIFITKFNAY